MRDSAMRSVAVPSRLRLLAFIVVALCGLLGIGPARAGEAKVAVAANFTEAAEEIGRAFQRKTNHVAVFSFGATGQLYAQINQGAPFEVFLSADRATATKAADQGFGIGPSQFTYAVGKLVLYSKNRQTVRGERTLKEGTFTKLAIANPAAAPYGAAAVETMKALGVYETLMPKIVQGQNITQAVQFVETGNAELGFVALSQVGGHTNGSRWIVPAPFHAAISQDAILLKLGAANPAAQSFIDFLKGVEASRITEKSGYGAGH